MPSANGVGAVHLEDILDELSDNAVILVLGRSVD